MRQRGFTLLEMTISIFIFGIVGLIALQLLTQSVRTTDKVIYRSLVVGDWHRAMNILEQDFLQLSNRSVRDEFGDVRPSFLSDGSGDVALTRSGWANPLQQQRSELQRVVYFLRENRLYRRYWNVLDRSQDNEPIDQLLLENVRSLQFEMIDREGRDHYVWPPATDERSSRDRPTLIAVRMILDIVEFGTVSQLWLVPESIEAQVQQETEDALPEDDDEATRQ